MDDNGSVVDTVKKTIYTVFGARCLCFIGHTSIQVKVIIYLLEIILKRFYLMD
jgi:hypothetical protein